MGPCKMCGKFDCVCDQIQGVRIKPPTKKFIEIIETTNKDGGGPIFTIKGEQYALGCLAIQLMDVVKSSPAMTGNGRAYGGSDNYDPVYVAIELERE